jgi:hypothetical protein
MPHTTLSLASLALLPLAVTFGSLGLGSLLASDDAEPTAAEPAPVVATVPVNLTEPVPGPVAPPPILAPHMIDSELAWFHDPAVPLPADETDPFEDPFAPEAVITLEMRDRERVVRPAVVGDAGPRAAAYFARMLERAACRNNQMRLIVNADELGDVVRTTVNAVTVETLADPATVRTITSSAIKAD